MTHQNSRRRSLVTLCAVPLLVAVVSASFVWMATEFSAEHRNALKRSEETAEGPLPDLIPLDAVGGRDGADARSEFPLADGSQLPVGTRRDGRRRAVTPDGRVFVRRRGDAHWTPLDGESGATVGSTGADPAKESVAEAQRVERQKALEEFARKFQQQQAETTGSSNVRVTALPGSETTGDTVAANWMPTGDTIVNPADRAPRIGRVRVPESRGRRSSTRDANAEQREIELVEQHGLRGDYYDFLTGTLHDIPDLTTLPPSHTRIDLSIDFGKDEDFKLPFDPETFAVLWRGQILVPSDGSYTFTCGSDDGVRVKIAGQTVVNYAGLRAYGESEGTLELTAGRHPIEVTFYENQVFASCRLFWKGPGIDRQIVPATAFVPPEDVAQIVQPHVTRIEPSSARVGDEVTLHGVGFSTAPVLNRVTFGGVVAEIVEATDRTLRVLVPVGASTGEVIAQVGPLSSLPEGFEVTSVSGLFAEYFLIGSDLNSMPDLDALTPYFVRLEGAFDFHQDHLWDLPYDPDVFALRATGFLYVPEESDYRITMGSDDGTLLRIGDQDFLKDPGLHAYHEVERTARFTKGFHPIEVRFFENRGVARLRLFWQRASDVERSIIPKGFFFPPEEIVDQPTPKIASIEPAGAGIGDLITLSGSGFGSSDRYTRVHFGGDVWARPESVSGATLTVRVPHSSETGDLRVETGITLSAAKRFTVTSPRGLKADYYVFSSSGELEQNATPEALAKLSPTLSRVEGDFQRESAKEWKLPFPATNFAVHWHGTLGVPYPTSRFWVLQADDGAFLHIDGKRAVDCGPFHSMHERYGSSHLTPGAHRVDIYYFQKDGEAKLKFLWTPIGKHEHRDVPDRWFQPDE